MTPTDYIAQANLTKSNSFHAHLVDPDILHAALGIATEAAGEFLDPIKKALFYGKPLDLVNMDEEVGDVLWYIAIYCKHRGITIEQLMDRNIEKLRKRFPNNFTEHDANNRDLDGERAILEREYK